MGYRNRIIGLGLAAALSAAACAAADEDILKLVCVTTGVHEFVGVGEQYVLGWRINRAKGTALAFYPSETVEPWEICHADSDSIRLRLPGLCNDASVMEWEIFTNGRIEARFQDVGPPGFSDVMFAGTCERRLLD